MIRSCFLKPRQICEPASKANYFFAVFSSFELGGIPKHLMTSRFPLASPRETLRVSGKQNSLFPLGPVIKYLSLELRNDNTTINNNEQGYFCSCMKGGWITHCMNYLYFRKQTSLRYFTLWTFAFDNTICRHHQLLSLASNELKKNISSKRLLMHSQLISTALNFTTSNRFSYNHMCQKNWSHAFHHLHF